MFHHYEDGLDSTNQKTCTITKTPPPPSAQDTTGNRPTPCANLCIYMRSLAMWTLRSVMSTGLKSWDCSCGSPCGSHSYVCFWGHTTHSMGFSKTETLIVVHEASPERHFKEFGLQEGISTTHFIDGIAAVCSNKCSAVPQGF